MNWASTLLDMILPPPRPSRAAEARAFETLLRLEARDFAVRRTLREKQDLELQEYERDFPERADEVTRLLQRCHRAEAEHIAYLEMAR